MFNIMNLNNIENIFYWTDNNGAVSLPGDTALTYRTKSDLPRFVAAVYQTKAGKAHGFNRGMIGRQ